MENGLQEFNMDELYQSFAPVIFRRSLQILADEEEALDAVQDVFMKLQEKLNTFLDASSLMTWVYRLTTNHCLNLLRSKTTRRKAMSILMQENGTRNVYDPTSSIERRDRLFTVSVAPRLPRWPRRDRRERSHCCMGEIPRGSGATDSRLRIMIAVPRWV